MVMNAIQVIVIALYGVSVLVGLLAFACTRRRGSARTGFAVAVAVIFPVIVLTGGLLLFALAGAGVAGQSNRHYDRQRRHAW